MVRNAVSQMLRAVAVGGFAIVAGLSGGGSAYAGATSLTGSWSGSGSISFSSGSKEKARCRARFAKTGASSYAMSATCATPSAKVEQSATLYKSGANSYSGSFFNQQYNTGGSIRITITGRTQSVRLTGEAGSAFFKMRKL
jgi:hypothetical protein